MTKIHSTIITRASSKDVAKKLIKLGVISALMGTAACSSQQGMIRIHADERGMRAFGDMITGSITTGKASPDKVTAHHQMRDRQAEVEALRYTSESFTGGVK